MTDPREGISSHATPSELGRGRRVLLIVSGGIAAYKACTVLRRLSDAGCSVRVAMTESAERFITPMTFEALSGQSVGTSLWGDGGEEPLDHIQWAREADVVVVVPGTANFITKIAQGVADDLASTLLTASTNKPIIVAPAMNDQMWANPANQENIRALKARRIQVVDPGRGYLACGVEAEGRLAEPEQIVDAVLERFRPGCLDGKRVVISAGGTRENIDAVRFIGNRSSGRMGIALAETALEAGAEVTLLLGPTELSPPPAANTLRFETSESLSQLLDAHAEGADYVAMAAAVSDYRPAQPTEAKLKKDAGVPNLELEATPDLLAGLGARKSSSQFLIGFALESGDDESVESQSKAKLERKNLDMICGNRADKQDEGFGGDHNRIYLLDASGVGNWLAHDDKYSLSKQVWERAASLHAAPAKNDAARENA